MPAFIPFLKMRVEPTKVGETPTHLKRVSYVLKKAILMRGENRKVQTK